MNQEEDDPDDVSYEVDGTVKIYTQKSDYHFLYGYYMNELYLEIEELNNNLKNKTNQKILQLHKCKIMIYSNILTLLNMVLELDNENIRKLIFNTHHELENPDSNYQKISEKLNRKTIKLINKNN